MSCYHPPASECRRLADWDPSLRFGLSLSRRGALLFIAKAMPSDEAGRADQERLMYQHVDKVFGFQGLYNKKGRLGGSDLPTSAKLVIWRWLDDPEGPFTTAGALTGNLVDFLRYNSKPKYVVEEERYEAALEQGRELQSAIDDRGAEHADMWKFAQRFDFNAHRQVITKEDFKADLKRAHNAKLLPYLDGERGRYKKHFIEKYGLDDALKAVEKE